jgi:hypothetical protein
VKELSLPGGRAPYMFRTARRPFTMARINEAAGAKLEWLDLDRESESPD